MSHIAGSAAGSSAALGAQGLSIGGSSSAPRARVGKRRVLCALIVIVLCVFGKKMELGWFKHLHAKQKKMYF